MPFGVCLAITFVYIVCVIFRAGIGLNVDKVMVIPFSSYVNRPWVSTLVSIVPSTIRTEPG